MPHQPSSSASDAAAWRARRDRWTVVLASVIVTLQLVTLPVLMSKAQEADAGASTATPTAEPDPAPTIAPQEFSGEQRGQTQPFPIEGGLTVFDVEHDGGGNFIVVLNDADGERVTGLVNVIGSFDGSTATYAPAGDYRLEVVGSDWSVTVRQPRFNTASSLPVTQSGEGVATGEPFRVPAGDGEPSEGGGGDDGQDGDGAQDDGDDGQDDGLRQVTFTITHQGEGNIRMTLLGENGQRAEGVLNARNAVDTTTRVRVPPGIYLLNVQAAGSWTAEIR